MPFHARYAAALFDESCDVIITEHHHKQKKDQPSGTALLLYEALGHRGEIHSIRSGTVPGEHTVLFSGTDEMLTISHRTLHRSVYARGALSAARFIISHRKPGLYGMDDLLLPETTPSVQK